MMRSALIVVPLVSAQFDGNPKNWDRVRRCDGIVNGDTTDYDPPCGPCEGVGGYVTSDDLDDFTGASCTVETVGDSASRVRPVWGADFTELKSSEILIGKKQDKACFAAFPSNDSRSDNCYKPQECEIFSEMNNFRAFIMKCKQSGNAWNVAGNVSSTIYHQNGNMWITNKLAKIVNQCICSSPREGGDPTKDPVGPVQFNWVDKLNYVATETVGVEYGVGDQTLDHWVFGPHHAWTDPQTGIIVRMWQPFNGLQIFEPGMWKEGSAYDDAVVKLGLFKTQNLFDQMNVEGTRAPDWCTKANSPLNTFRIKCTDEGFPESVNETSDALPSHVELAQQPLGDEKSVASDLRRARSKVPRNDYKGDDFGSMSQTLNSYLVKHAPQSRSCDTWTAEELQNLQISLLMLRDPKLNDVYVDADDSRQMSAEVETLVKEWDELNALARTDPDLARAHRDGHCHEAVMWYVHHLPEGMKDLIKDEIALPLLSDMKHDLKVVEHGPRLHEAYKAKVSCASCHSAEYPSAIAV